MADSVSDREVGLGSGKPGGGHPGEPRSISGDATAVDGGDTRPDRRRQRSLGLSIAAIGVLLVVLRATGCMERLFYYPMREATPLPEGYEGGERVWFESSDGTRLHGWFLPPQPPRAEPAPAVLHVHGNAGSIASHLYFTEYLPAAGFGLLVFDYRGYGESDGAARRREPLIADTHAALDALLARPEVDPDRVGIYGQSLGGGIALVVMEQRHEVAAAVIESAFTSWREIAADSLGGGEAGPFARGTAAMLIRDTHRPIDAIAGIDRPLLLLHGTNDAIVPVTHGRRLAAAAPRAELVEMPGGQHNSLRQSHPEVDRLVVDFFRQHLANDRTDQRR